MDNVIYSLFYDKGFDGKDKLEIFIRKIMLLDKEEDIKEIFISRPFDKDYYVIKFKHKTPDMIKYNMGCIFISYEEKINDQIKVIDNHLKTQDSTEYYDDSMTIIITDSWNKVDNEYNYTLFNERMTLIFTISECRDIMNGSYDPL